MKKLLLFIMPLLAIVSCSDDKDSYNYDEIEFIQNFKGDYHAVVTDIEGEILGKVVFTVGLGAIRDYKESKYQVQHGSFAITDPIYKCVFSDFPITPNLNEGKIDFSGIMEYSNDHVTGEIFSRTQFTIKLTLDEKVYMLSPSL